MGKSIQLNYIFLGLLLLYKVFIYLLLLDYDFLIYYYYVCLFLENLGLLCPGPLWGVREAEANTPITLKGNVTPTDDYYYYYYLLFYVTT